MQLTIDRAVLARELALVAPAAERKTTNPILSHAKVEARGDRLTLTATDLECGLISTVAADVKQEGVICLPAKRLLDYVRTLSGDTVTIRTDDKQYATVTSGRARARIAGMDPVSYPELPQAPEAAVTMDARALSRAFGRVAFAISAEESRFTINGALLAVDGSLVKCVTTDGHRLAYVEQDGAMCAAGAFKALVPKHAITHFAKIADAGNGAAAIAADDNHLFFATGDRQLIARKLVGNFPDYSRVLPGYDSHVVVDREALESALKRVIQFADERSRAIRLTFKDGEVAIAASSMESGESEESVPTEGTFALETGFNAQYLLDGLGAITHPKVALIMRDAKSAGELRPMRGAGTEQDPYAVATGSRYVVMPMRI